MHVYDKNYIYLTREQCACIVLQSLAPLQQEDKYSSYRRMHVYDKNYIYLTKKHELYQLAHHRYYPQQKENQ